MTLDLKDDAALVAEYKRHHRKMWPEVTKSIRDSGVDGTSRIHLPGTRMFMIMEVNENFHSSEGTADAANLKVREWEELMWKFQQALPQAGPAEKWMLMEKIYDLNG